jgi:predicted nucleic acid-binding protein
VIFVDTWAWLALAYKKDPFHAIALAEHRKLVRAGRRYVTTDYVFAELVSALFRAVPFAGARAFGEGLLQAFDAGTYQFVHVSPYQFHRAWQLRVRYHDKPGISFVDLTSMVVMQDLGITEVFTGDAHFEQVGLGFRRVP